jgi:hypothetical protein
MEALMNGAMLVEATVLSFVMALGVSWLCLRGLFRLMPGAQLEAVPIRLGAARGAGASNRNAA